MDHLPPPLLPLSISTPFIKGDWSAEGHFSDKKYKNYDYFVGQCGPFCGLKCRFWQNKFLVPQKPHMGVQTVLLSFCSVVIFLSALQVIPIVTKFMFLGINMFWALLRVI